jgi:hypothetical protein
MKKKMLKGMQRLEKRDDCRKPITLDLLNNIVHILTHIAFSTYEVALFSAAFTLVFFAFLRVGEFAESGLYVRHILCRSDLLIIYERNIMHVTLRSSKTDQLGHKTQLEVSKHKNDSVCPISNMQSYLDVRPNIEGTLFCHLNGKPLSRYQVSTMLTKAIRFIGLNDEEYNTHSFRIGAATTASLMGNKGNNKITELRTILQRERQNS